MSNTNSICILGAGSWGTAIAVLLAKKGYQVKLWSAVPDEIKMLRENREHKFRLPGVILPSNIEIVDDLEKACKDNLLIVFAVASPFIRQTAKNACPYIKEGTILVNVSKGIEDKTFLTLSQIIEEEIPQAKSCVLSGPSHAEEVSRSIPTVVVAGAKDKEDAVLIQDVFMADNFRVYTSPDVMGIELGGAIKNVIALAAGVIDGLGFGDNTKAALITRGILEISRLGEAMGTRAQTFYGLSGIGDLIVTCTSNHSRNHNAGYFIGQGHSVDEALKMVGQVVEGVNCAKAAKNLADKYNVNMPIVEQINKVLFEGVSPTDGLNALFTRAKNTEYMFTDWD